jgi:hypothetical protein
MCKRAELSLKECDSAPWYSNAEDSRSPIGSIFESMSIDSGIAADRDNAPC